jgi:hypothetical protein
VFQDANEQIDDKCDYAGVEEEIAEAFHVLVFWPDFFPIGCHERQGKKQDGLPALGLAEGIF